MSDNPDETINYLRFIAFFIDIATETVLKVFHYHIQTYKDTAEFLSSPEVKKEITKLRKRKVINEAHYNLLTAYVPNASKFDISLLITLINNTGIVKDSPRPLSTDILNLRDIRNSVIAHRPKAALYKEKFEKLWEKLKDILIRLNDAVDPETTEVLSKKIESYRNRRFSDEDDQEYKQKIEESCEEISRLQQKMEELSLKCNVPLKSVLDGVGEFTIFLQKTPEKYVQYVQLLFEGGKFVLVSVLNKGLADSKLDLRTVLFCKRSELERNIDSRELLRQIFTNDDDASSHINIDTNTWGIILLAEVIEVSLGLTQRQMKKVRTIKEARKIYAETALKAISNSDIQRFYGCCEDLVSSIELLSSNLDESAQVKCDEHIDRYKAQLTDTQVSNPDEYLDQLKAKGTDVKNLYDLYQETVEKLKDCVKQMGESGIPFNKEHVLHLKMIVLGENEDTKQKVENALLTVIETSLAKSDISPELAAPRQEADKIVEVLQSIPGVKADDVKRECIILSIKCFSYQNLLNIIDYLTGELFNEHMLSLTMEMSFVFDEVIAIEGNLTFESLNSILTHLSAGPTNDELAVDGISLPVVCYSPEGMQSVLEFVRTENFTNSINAIADGLSSFVEETISLKVIPDCKELTGVIENTLEESETASSSGSHEEENDYSDRFLKTKDTPKDINCVLSSTTEEDDESDEELTFDDLLEENTGHISGEVISKGVIGLETIPKPNNHIEKNNSGRFNSEEKDECITAQPFISISREQDETHTYVSLKETKPENIGQKLVDIQTKNALKEDIIRHYRKKHATLPIGFIMEDVQFVKLYVRPFPLYDITTQSRETHVKDLHNVFYSAKNKCKCKNIYITSETGMGKTAFMKWLTLCWCDAHSLDEDSTNDEIMSDVFSSDEREEMLNFEFLFYVSIGDVSFDQYHIDHLIYKSILNSLTESRAYEIDFLNAILDTETCLIIMDGIDESPREQLSVLPEMIRRTTTSYITTCTTCTFERLNTNSNEVEKHIQIKALERDKSDMLSRNILSSVLEDPDEESNNKFTVVLSPYLSSGTPEACLKFDRMLIEKKISHLKSFPLVLAHLLSLWLVGEKIDQSQCEIYSGIIVAMVNRASLKKAFSQQLLKFKTNEPVKEECLQVFKPYHPLFMQLGRLAFITLLRLPQKSSFIFAEDDVVQVLSTDLTFQPLDIIEAGLNIGILCMHSQTENIGRKNCLSFFHKSVQKYFAALYMSYNKSAIEQVKSACYCVSLLFEYAAAFVFLSGLNDGSAKNILEHLTQVNFEDEISSKYRCKVNSEKVTEIQFIQDMIIDCVRESRNNARGKLRLHLDDVVIDGSCGNELYKSNLKRVLKGSAIRSLSIDEHGIREYESVFEGFDFSRLLKLRIENLVFMPKIDTLTTLRYIYLKCFGIVGSSISYDSILALFHLPVISGLGLEEIDVTHNQAKSILEKINEKTKLTQIVLRSFNCITPHTDVCNGLELDLKSHRDLHLLEIYELPVTKVQVNSKMLEEFKVGMLPDNSVSELLQGLEDTLNLKTIAFSEISTKNDINQIALALPKFTSLTCLDISHINLDSRIIALPVEMKSLVEIKLICNSMTLESLLTLINLIQSLKQQIVTMKIVKCKVSPQKGIKRIQELIRSSAMFNVLYDDDDDDKDNDEELSITFDCNHPRK